MKIVRTGVAAAALALALSSASAQPAQNWVAAWATSQQGLAQTKITNATVRMIARVTLPGDSVRIRLDNTFGKQPVTFGKAAIAPRAFESAVAYGQSKPVTFGGKESVTIPAGGSAESDAIPMPVDAQEDLAVSLYVTGADVQPSQHNLALTTSYLTENGSGDQTASADGKPFTGKTTQMFWLKSIDVHPAQAATAIVAFGDSITDGRCSGLDAHERWEDVVQQRLALASPIAHSVINEGIAGNTALGGNLMPPINSPPALERFERDVLSHPGVSHVVIFVGTNDIRRDVPADKLIGALKDMISRVHAKGMKAIGATIIPRHITVPGIEDTGWSDAKNKVRDSVNAWMRGKDSGFDAVLDFDKVVRDPKNPDLINAAYGCGDGVHPSSLGYLQMGKSVNLSIFGR